MNLYIFLTALHCDIVVLANISCVSTTPSTAQNLNIVIKKKIGNGNAKSLKKVLTLCLNEVVFQTCPLPTCKLAST